MGTSQTDFEYDEAMCATMPEPTIGKIKAKKSILINYYNLVIDTKYLVST